ncbi:LacI family transcriptional regulator [Paenochrobactrum gallinarii]|uniref:LacI family transcriptional regulator n=1 Tax=Paenochrobactrum gallinarii TaxID=643673 RepID=A0A841LUS4_9HYPH|nr:LacI family DNA-binding transcriptional regulator [Paenochrobactrum gallinarii]MBB6261056.1 LacI family transcriptional regulator [Paenochrobactrum gallinarii]
MDHRKVTLLEVARAAGVSRATVSLVVRKSPLVAEDTRKKVERVMAELDYVRDLGAARLRSNSSHTIGVIVPNLVNSFFTEFLAGVERVMEEEDRVVLLANSQDDTTRQNAILQRFRGHGVDGVILCPAEETDPDLPERLQKWGLAVVQTLREVGTSATDYAGADYAAGILLAIQHLVGQGHRRIAFLSVPARTSAREERLDGVTEALALCGAENAGIIEAELSWKGSEQSAAQVLALPGKPTAVLCFNDILAAGLMLGLRRAGCEPGRDIAVIGLDGLPLAELTYPPLTSVAVDPARIGEMAARLLARRLVCPGIQVERSIVEPRLIIRASSALNMA